MLALWLAVMPAIWTDTTRDGTSCTLNADATGLVAYVGVGGKRKIKRVAKRHTTLPECISVMRRVLDPSLSPLPLPADLYTLLCELPLLAGNASKAVRANVVSILSLGNPRQHEHPVLLAGVQ